MSEYSGLENLEGMTEAHNYHRFLTRLVLSSMSEDIDGRPVVDFGAGDGTYALLVREFGFNVLCVEPDPGLRRSLEDLGFQVRASLADIKDESVPYCYTLNVLEHIDDDEAALRELHRVVKRGGTLFVYVPAFECLYGAMDRKVGHFRRYRLKSLMEEVVRAGFVIQSARYADSLGFAAALVYRFALGNRGDGVLSRTSVRRYDRFVLPFSLRLDHLTSKWFGKNLMLTCCRP